MLSNVCQLSNDDMRKDSGTRHPIILTSTSLRHGAYTAPNVLKFHWWRFNAVGYFWGMFVGIVAALVIPWLAFFANIAPLYAFPTIFAASLLASVLASLLTDPDPFDALERFYVRVRPWGFWGPVADRVGILGARRDKEDVDDDSPSDDEDDDDSRDACYDAAAAKEKEASTGAARGEMMILRERSRIRPTHSRHDKSSSPVISGNNNFGKDAFNVAVGVAWQTALTMFGICFVLRMWNGVAAAVATVVGTTAVLKFTWYDALVDYYPEAATMKNVTVPNDDEDNAEENVVG